MVKEIKAQLNAEENKFAIIVSRFNEFITGKLLAGAIDCLERHGAKDEQITIIWVPGAIEISLTARKLADSSNYDAIICLGAVIQGQTAHFDYVCQQVSRGVGQVNYDTGVPTIFGVITCGSIEQAVERAGTKQGNAGTNAALSAIEMANLLKQI